MTLRRGRAGVVLALILTFDAVAIAAIFVLVAHVH